MTERMDELSDIWADILPKRSPEQRFRGLSSQATHVWFGIHGELHREPSDPSYKRVRVDIPEGDMMFVAVFPPCTSPFTVTAMGLYSAERGGELLFHSVITPVHLLAGDTPNARLTIEGPAIRELLLQRMERP